jgi:hypothetical protein
MEPEGSLQCLQHRTVPFYLSKIHFNIVAYLFKARTMEPDKQPLLANGSDTTFDSRQRPRKQTTEQCMLLGTKIDGRC